MALKHFVDLAEARLLVCGVDVEVEIVFLDFWFGKRANKQVANDDEKGHRRCQPMIRAHDDGAGQLRIDAEPVGTIAVGAQGDGPVPLIMAECNRHKGLRAIVRPPESGEFVLSEDTSLQGFLGKGVLAITIDPDKGERYQGIVPLEAPSLAGCLEAYFAQSEQLPTRLWLMADGQRAGGLFLQALPKQIVADEDINADQWQTVVTLANTVKPDELLYLDHSQKLYLLFNEFSIRLFEPASLQFDCTCSETRSLHALRQLGREELQEILIDQGYINIDCQFCNQQYRFEQNQIDAMFDDDEPTLH